MTPDRPAAAMRSAQLFERLAARYLSDPAVSQGTGFGSNPGLRVGGRIFAMLSDGKLVVKISKERVDQLIESGTGERFDPRHDRRLMKEWVTIPVRPGRDWEQLAGEALEFVRSEGQRGKARRA